MTDDYEMAYKEQVLINANLQQKLWGVEESARQLNVQLSTLKLDLSQSKQALKQVKSAYVVLNKSLKLSKEASDVYKDNWLNAINKASEATQKVDLGNRPFANFLRTSVQQHRKSIK